MKFEFRMLGYSGPNFWGANGGYWGGNAGGFYPGFSGFYPGYTGYPWWLYYRTGGINTGGIITGGTTTGGTTTGTTTNTRTIYSLLGNFTAQFFNIMQILNAHILSPISGDFITTVALDGSSVVSKIEI